MCLHRPPTRCALRRDARLHVLAPPQLRRRLTRSGGVRKEGVEPSRVSPPDPKSGASASSATFASGGRHYVTTLCFPFWVLGSGFWVLVLGSGDAECWNLEPERRTKNLETRTR